MIRFYSYRLNLIEPSKVQMKLSFPEDKTKEDQFYNLVYSLNDTQKTTFIYRGIKYFIFFLKQISKEIYALELAKEEIYIKPIEGLSSIEEIHDKRTPFIYLILDL